MRRYPPPKTGPHTGWSPDRNRALQAKFRRLVLQRDHYSCQRCGWHDPSGRGLHAHHIAPGYSAECGRTLCRACHKIEDAHAR